MSADAAAPADGAPADGAPADGAGPLSRGRDLAGELQLRSDLGPLVADGRWDLILSALNAVNSMITVSDLREEDQPLVYVNDYFCEFTGYDRSEAIGRNCRFLQDAPGGRDEDQPGVREIREAVRERRRCDVLVRNYKRDGTPFWNELFLSPVCAGGPDRQRDQDGEVTHYVGVQNNVTDRIECDRERYVLAEALRTLEESVIVTDGHLEKPGPTMRFVNDAFTRMSGYSWDEAVGSTPRMMQGPDTDHGETGRLREELARGETFRGEAVNYRSDGSRYLVQWTACPVWAHGPMGGLYAGPGVAARPESARGLRPGPPAGTEPREAREGPPSHYVASQRDMTERRALEREMLEGRTEEQARIARDLHDGPTQDVAAVRIMAGALARELGVDFNDPGELERAARHADGTERFDSPAALAAHLYQQAGSAADGVRQVARGLMPVRAGRGGLVEAMRRLADTMNAGAGVGTGAGGAGGPAVRFRGSEDDEPADADVRNELYQIAKEAVGNAVRHAGAREITVDLHRDAPEGAPAEGKSVAETGDRAARPVVLTIEDDGAGIPERLEDHGGRVTHTDAPSGGVGLRSMRYRAELLGATFSVERRGDREGGGTRVRVRLPGGGPPRGRVEVIRGGDDADPAPTPTHRRHGPGGD